MLPATQWNATVADASAGGNLNDLRQFINVSSDDEWMLIASWLVATMHPHGPYPVLGLHGEKGATKSSATRFLRNLVDPSQAPARGMPKDDQTLAIYAKNSRVLAFENLSHIPAWFSDALCTYSTGAGQAYRTHYTNDEETIFSAKCPVVLNGITELAQRGDLLDRSIVVTLQAIPEHQRKSEKEIKAAYEQARPRLVGALLDVVSAALRNLPTTRLPRLPRMADFALWTVAAESALGWKPGAWMDAYTTNRENAVSIELEASPLAGAVIKLLERQDSHAWEGLATALLHDLTCVAEDEALRSPKWPKDSTRLSGDLRRLAGSLRQQGIDSTFHRLNKGTQITLVQRSVADGVADLQRSVAKSVAKNEGVTPEKERRDPKSGGGVAVSPPFSILTQHSEEKEKKEGEKEGEIERFRKTATPPPPATPGREILNAIPTTEGTAARQIAHAPIAVQERDSQAEPISLKEVREQRNNPRLPWQPGWNGERNLKRRLYLMAEAMNWPKCESAGILDSGDKSTWYALCYEPGHTDEAADAYDILKLCFDGRPE
jgi:hypothetical protein